MVVLFYDAERVAGDAQALCQFDGRSGRRRGDQDFIEGLAEPGFSEVSSDRAKLFTSTRNFRPSVTTASNSIVAPRCRNSPFSSMSVSFWALSGLIPE
jgi:hypothetical protein